MALFCGNCGSRLVESAAFCGGCGSKVPATAQPAAVPAPPSSDSAYAPLTPGYEGVPQTFTPAPPAAESAYPPVTPSYESVPQTFTPPPSASASAYTPVTPSYPPAPAATEPAPPPAAQAGYTPVSPYASAAPPAYQAAQSYRPPAQPGYPAAQTPYAPGVAYPAAKKSNTLLKVVIALVLVLFIGGALALAGLWYAAQKIKAKAHAVAVQALGEDAANGGVGGLLSGMAGDSSSNGNSAAIKGDPCRFLTKEEVSAAVGTQVIRAEAQDGGCNYIAHGDAGEAAAKHMSSMLGGLGVDSKTQKSIQKLAGGMFAQQQADDKTLAADAASGEVPVLVVSFTAGNATAEMRRNRKALRFLNHNAGTASSSETGDLAGIGDEAYVAGGSMIVLRKGETTAHLLYVSCPCNTSNVTPLARLIATRL